MTDTPAWYTVQERGSMVGMRIVVWLYRIVGRRTAKLLLHPIVAYYFLTANEARRASFKYLQRVYATPGGDQALGSPPSSRHVFRQFLEFARSLLDRVGFWLADAEAFRIMIRGREHLDRVASLARGAVVLGSHLGSFDAMRLMADMQSPLRVHVLMYTQHAPQINRLLGWRHKSLGALVRVIPIVPGSLEHAIEARACVRRGELVAILADRTPVSRRGRTSRVEFLGSLADLPQGPVRLAALLGCPVLMMTALRVGDRAYEICIEPLAERIVLPREGREEAIRSHCQHYADRLAGQCMRAPHQWFNFFDFWR